jgi:SAM-dependent methyltransferase
MQNYRNLISSPSSLRPSKHFAYKKIFQTINGNSVTSVLDLGCADFKLRKYFSGNYVGIDREKPKVSYDFFREYETYFFENDLNDFYEVVKDRKFDIIICTHVFHWLTEQERINVLLQIHKLLLPNTVVVLQIQKSDLTPQIRKLIGENFSLMGQFSYRTPISRIYEFLFCGDRFFFGKLSVIKKLFWILASVSEKLVVNNHWYCSEFIFFLVADKKRTRSADGKNNS